VKTVREITIDRLHHRGREDQHSAEQAGLGEAQAILGQQRRLHHASAIEYRSMKKCPQQNRTSGRDRFAKIPRDLIRLPMLGTHASGLIIITDTYFEV